MSEKPPHVQVAEALGCKPKLSWGTDWDCTCREKTYGRPHSMHLIHDECCHDGEGLGCDLSELARYDTDWSAAGPLIEELREEGWNVGVQAENGGAWLAWKSDIGQYRPHQHFQGRGATPQLAVCDLILALKAAGKLS